jgi:hypothetical protein
MAEHGGRRFGAGRKPDPIKKSRITINVPTAHKTVILSKFRKIVKAYEDKCKREL